MRIPKIKKRLRNWQKEIRKVDVQVQANKQAIKK